MTTGRGSRRAQCFFGQKTRCANRYTRKAILSPRVTALEARYREASLLFLRLELKSRTFAHHERRLR